MIKKENGIHSLYLNGKRVVFLIYQVLLIYIHLINFKAPIIKHIKQALVLPLAIICQALLAKI